jgi:hypothetical protein
MRLLLVFFLSFPALSFAGQLYVCTDGAGKKSFQEMPCSGSGTSEVREYGVREVAPVRPGKWDYLTGAERNELISEQFSGWDGSHIKLVSHVKELMNEPGSFDHVSTKYWDKGDYLLVRMRFRGRNGFGGVVVDSASALVGLDGEVIQYINQ